MRIVFMGTPGFAVPALEALALDGYEVTAVYTQPDRDAGRGRVPVAPPVKKAAVALGLPVEQPVSLKRDDAVKRLAALRPDVIVVAAYGQLLSAPVLAVPAHRVLNIHPSLLPAFRGASPVASAIMSGDEFTGVSIMLLDEGMDTGPLLAQAQVSVSSRDTTASLTEKLARIGAQLLLDVMPRWVKGELDPRTQDESRATYTRRLEKGDGEIDWSLSARELWLRVRALNPWPGCYTRWRGKQLKIIEAALSPAGGPGPGRVAVPERANTFWVGTGDGVLEVLKVQQEGKQEMAAADFLRGQREFTGAVLPD